ncbi:sulfatase [Seonamhaeicola maritimus]|uniref:sulfatase n=1 Tax=Seonamhaeicola maritimus TaxID=2591822 RepID=UPI00249535B8|nr:sulfatase [Seonamhaeicola maritimus]
MKIKLLIVAFFVLQFTMAQDKPNVLFIAIDDLNDYVSCMNGPLSVPTPNIDRLAKQGTLFENAHCQAPICGPSRASIMTGLYPSTSGNYLQVNDKSIKKASRPASESIFMPDYFEQFGYKTMAVGKIYHGGDAAGTFKEYGGYHNWDGLRPEKRVNYDPARLPHKVGRTMTDWGAYPEHDSIVGDYKIAKWAVDKLSKKHNKPFFLGVGFNKPHVPWHVPQKWYDMFPLENIKTPPYKKDDLDDISLMAQKVAEAPMMPTTEELIKWGQWKEVIQAYSACIAFVDAQVGKVLDALENSEYANNTIIVLWSDHGYHLGEKNRVAKQALWERDTRTVLVIKEVNQMKGKQCHAPVGLIDMYPTLVDMCNLPSLNQLEGNSIKDLVIKPKTKWENPTLCFYGEGNVVVRSKRYRLTQYEDQSLELYDMKKDPNEWHNLANNKKYQKIIKKLQENIPKEWTPLSEYSTYDFNDYFRAKSKKQIKY